jgi:hypothetical protein
MAKKLHLKLASQATPHLHIKKAMVAGARRKEEPMRSTAVQNRGHHDKYT